MIESFDLLVQTTIVTSVAILVVFGLRVCVRRLFGVHCAYALWLLVPISLLALALPARSLPDVPADFGVPDPGSAYVEEASPVQAIDESIPSQNADRAHYRPAYEAGFWNSALLLIWITGVLVSLGRFAWHYRRFVRSCGTLHPTPQEDVFVASGSSVGPAVIGVLNPKIVVPQDFETRFSVDEQAMVLAHERAHLKSGDTRINLLVSLFVILLWFNPLVRWAARVMRQDQEIARDADALLVLPGWEVPYSKALVNAQAGASVLSPTGCAWTPSHPLIDRVAALTCAAPSSRRRQMGYAMIAGLLVFGVLATWATQPATAASRSTTVNLFEAPVAMQDPILYAATTLELGEPVRVNLILEERDTIELSLAAGLTATPELNNSTLSLGAVAGAMCQPGAATSGPADIHIRAPVGTEIKLAGASHVRVAGGPEARVTVSDCAALELGEIDRPILISASDQARVRLQALSAESNIVLAGASQLQIDQLSAPLALDQIGASQARILRADQAVEATVAGASGLRFDRIEAPTADILVVGASDLSIDDGAVRALDLKVLGSSSASIAASVSTAEIAAAGEADIALDRVDHWTVLSAPDEAGRLQINGEGLPP